MHNSSAMTAIRLSKLADCTPDHHQQLLRIRNHPSVREAMYSDHVIGADEHSNWLEATQRSARSLVFLVLDADAVRGMVSLSDIDQKHKKTDWAFYLSPEARGGLGAALEFSWLSYVFDQLGFEKLNCEVLETNPNVVKMHKRFGFVEEGFRRENIIKGGKRIGVHFLGLTRGEWSQTRTDVGSSIAEIVQRFKVSIDHD